MRKKIDKIGQRIRQAGNGVDCLDRCQNSRIEISAKNAEIIMPRFFNRQFRFGFSHQFFYKIVADAAFDHCCFIRSFFQQPASSRVNDRFFRLKTANQQIPDGVRVNDPAEIINKNRPIAVGVKNHSQVGFAAADGKTQIAESCFFHWIWAVSRKTAVRFFVDNLQF